MHVASRAFQESQVEIFYILDCSFEHELLAVKEYWEISQHIFSSFISFPRFPGGNWNKSTSDNDLYESWTFLEVVLCLLVSDCRSSNLGNSDFFSFS
jgi:hypothetical protein